MSWIRLWSLVLKLQKFVQPLYKHEFAKGADVSTPMLGFAGRTIHAAKLVELAESQAHRSAGSAMMQRPIVACSAMLDVKIADQKDDFEDEFNMVRAQVSWPEQP